MHKQLLAEALKNRNIVTPFIPEKERLNSYLLEGNFYKVREWIKRFPKLAIEKQEEILTIAIPVECKDQPGFREQDWREFAETAQNMGLDWNALSQKGNRPFWFNLWAKGKMDNAIFLLEKIDKPSWRWPALISENHNLKVSESQKKLVWSFEKGSNVWNTLYLQATMNNDDLENSEMAWLARAIPYDKVPDAYDALPALFGLIRNHLLQESRRLPLNKLHVSASCVLSCIKLFEDVGYPKEKLYDHIANDLQDKKDLPTNPILILSILQWGVVIPDGVLTATAEEMLAVIEDRVKEGGRVKRKACPAGGTKKV